MIVDYIDDHRSRFGVDLICAVLSEHGVSIAPSTYYAVKQHGPVSAAELDDAYTANALFDLWTANRVSTACASCGMPPNVLVTAWAVTRWRG